MKNFILLAFYLLTDVVSIIILILFYSDDSRLSGDLDTLRRRSYNVIYYCYKKPVFYQLILLFLIILKLFEVSLEVEFVLKFEVEFDIEFELIELLELELVIEFLIELSIKEE